MSDDVLKSFQKSEEWKEGVDGRIELITEDSIENALSALNNESIVAFVFDDKGLIAGMSIKGAKFKKIDSSNW
jgi:lipid-binding SYLF domain-containing protein